MQAIWNNTVVAESDDTVLVEGNYYFPESSLKREFITFSNHKTSCAWKGQASYYSLLVNASSIPTPCGSVPTQSPRLRWCAAVWRFGTV